VSTPRKLDEIIERNNYIFDEDGIPKEDFNQIIW